MKNFNVKTIALSMFLFAISLSLTAQTDQVDSIAIQQDINYSVLEHRHEFRFAAGFVSTIPNYVNATIYPWYDPSHTMEDVINTVITSVIPAVNIGYNYRFCERFAMGVTLATDFEWYHSGMVNFQLYYLKAHKFEFYGDLGLGATLCSEIDRDDMQVFPNFGIYPIGLKFGNKFGGFVELGYGYKGLMNFGVFLRTK